ncbi:MAG: efflux RND transporter periplasmic adaptor subunit [Pseudomonadota bacterium]
MRFLRQSIIGLFLASVTLGLLLYAGQIVSGAIRERLSNERPAPVARERVYAVDLIPATASDEIPVLEAFGEISARRTLELRASVGGRVIALSPRFEDGGRVAAGEVLVSIDPADLQAEVDVLAADVADAEAEVRDADRGLELARLDEEAARAQATLRRLAFDRQVDLANRGVGSAASVETAELAAAAAEAVVITRRQAVTQADARIDQAATRLVRAKIALTEARRDLEDTTIEAPFDGTLGETSLVQGGLVAANERLAVLIDPGDLEVSFRVSTAQYARLIDATGELITAPVTVTLQAAGFDLTAEGEISRVNAATGEGQTGRLVFARIGRAAGFRPGDFVTVAVQEPVVEDVVRLPASAYDADGHVLVLDAEGRLEVIPVDLVRRQGDAVLVRGAALEGREVVRQLTPLLGPGIKVRPIRRGTSEASAAPTLLELTEERRARLMAFVQDDRAMGDDARARILARLAEPRVPARMVARIESRMGG